MSNIGSWLRGSLKEWLLASLIVFVVLGGTTFYVYPIYYGFDAPGEMVALEDIGIASSVHFVTVYSGITETIIERYQVELQLDDEAIFYRLDPYFANYDWDLLAEYREDTIMNAYDLLLEEAGYEEELESGEELSTRLEELLANTTEFYGDSLGLMVAIGLHEELHQYDYSAGGQYVIAGTGTMEEDASVGSIGGLEHKLVLAEREGVTHFFIPQDEALYEEDSNVVEAARVARERELSMEIIAVSTLAEAIHYLDRLIGVSGSEEVSL